MLTTKCCPRIYLNRDIIDLANSKNKPKYNVYSNVVKAGDYCDSFLFSRCKALGPISQSFLPVANYIDRFFPTFRVFFISLRQKLKYAINKKYDTLRELSVLEWLLLFFNNINVDKTFADVVVQRNYLRDGFPAVNCMNIYGLSLKHHDVHLVFRTCKFFDTRLVEGLTRKLEIYNAIV